MRAVLELTGPHPPEEVQVLFDRPLPVRTRTSGLGDGTAVGADLFFVQAIDVSVAVLDESFGVGIKLLEVIRGVVEVAVPVEAQPLHGLFDGLDILGVFRRGVGVVEAEVAARGDLGGVVLGDAEVKADAFGVADMEVAVGFGRKARDDVRVAAFFEVAVDDVADKVRRHLASVLLDVRRGGGLGWGSCSKRL